MLKDRIRLRHVIDVCDVQLLPVAPTEGKVCQAIEVSLSMEIR